MSSQRPAANTRHGRTLVTPLSGSYALESIVSRTVPGTYQCEIARCGQRNAIPKSHFLGPLFDAIVEI